jgi:hypothetical protein
MSAAKALTAKMKAIEDLKKKLAEAESEVETSRETIMAEVKERLVELAPDLRALGTSRIVIEITDEEIKVTVGGEKAAKAVGTSNGNGHKTELPEGCVYERKYKGKNYTLKVEDGELNVRDEYNVHCGTFTSPTAAAQWIIGNKKSINGRGWWSIK